MKQIEDQRFGSAGANGCPSLGTMRRTGAILFLSLVVFCTFSICLVQNAQLELLGRRHGNVDDWVGAGVRLVEDVNPALHLAA